MSGSDAGGPISTEDFAGSAGAILSEGPPHEQAYTFIQLACRGYHEMVLERFWPPRCHLGRGIEPILALAPCPRLWDLERDTGPTWDLQQAGNSHATGHLSRRSVAQPG